MPTWTGVSLLDALETELEGRAGLSGVKIETFDPGDEMPGSEVIFFNDVIGTQEAHAFAKKREDEYVAKGVVWVKKPGAGRAVVKEARDRAEALLAEIENELRDDQTVNGTVGYAQITNISLFQRASADRGRIAQLEFDVSVSAYSL